MSGSVTHTGLLNDLRVQYSLRRKAVRVLEGSRVDLAVRQLLHRTQRHRLAWDVVGSDRHGNHIVARVSWGNNRVDLEVVHSRQVHATTWIADCRTENHRVVIQVQITVERRVRARHTRRRSDIVLALIVQCRDVVALTGRDTDRSSVRISGVQRLPEPLAALLALSRLQAGLAGGGILSQSLRSRHQ